uniref:Uncharacterized protein n=1 Tax=Glossina brevipalpis TaxID=37001 RepID=A0A1A9X0S3_9MUSC
MVVVQDLFQVEIHNAYIRTRAYAYAICYLSYNSLIISTNILYKRQFLNLNSKLHQHFVECLVNPCLAKSSSEYRKRNNDFYKLLIQAEVDLSEAKKMLVALIEEFGKYQ